MFGCATLLDGTTAFASGYPTFVFSLALVQSGQPIIGLLYDPTLDQLIIAEKGNGTFLNGKITSVSTDTHIKNTLINLDTDIKLVTLRKKLLEEWAFTPTFYSGQYAALLVAAGEFGASIYEYDKPWDAAAPKIIIEEARGKVTDIFGNEQRYDQPTNGYIASNGRLHGVLLQYVQKSLAS